MLPPRAVVLACFALASLGSAANAQSSERKTRNVVLIVTDGLRWQELFSGAERLLMSAQPGGVRDTTALMRDFWRETPEARRQALLPFVWGAIAKNGQIYGNQQKGSVARITNDMRFSYPGYNEIFTGVFDPRIDSNEYPPNPNVTVFEWLARKSAFRGRVAAFATWDAFSRIFNEQRAGFPVQDGWDPPFAKKKVRTAREETIDELYRTSVRMWEGNSFDAPLHLAAKEYIRTAKPRLMFVGYGETDEWAHSGMYDLLLRSAHQVDDFIGDLWKTMQAMPEYRGSTTFIITTDHGRGSGPDKWKDHGRDVDGAENIWMAILGPDTPAWGELGATDRVTQSQIAATIAALLGERYTADFPRAGAPLTRAIGHWRPGLGTLSCR